MTADYSPQAIRERLEVYSAWDTDFFFEVKHLLRVNEALAGALGQLDGMWTDHFPHGPDNAITLTKQTADIWKAIRAALAIHRNEPNTAPEVASPAGGVSQQPDVNR